ncbi:MAG: Cdc6/Cdc18 family protein [Candidatus Nanoarchaeia archaeon]
MSLFKDMLRGDESLFINEVALEYDFLPKLLPYRENEQRYLATCIAPLLQNRTGRNLFIFGVPGIGKTAATRFVLRDLEEESDEVVPIYVNCWQKNTTYKVMLELSSILGYKFTHNKRTDELFSVVKQILNKRSVVFVFDEVDKLEDYDFLYSLMEEIYKKSIFMITNHEEWLDELDQRIRSRLLPEKVNFKAYNNSETRGILKQRIKYAFVQDTWDANAFEIAATKTSEIGDVRTGLYILKEAGLAAENASSRKITKAHVDEAVKKIEDFTTKKKESLEDETKNILDLVKVNSGKKIGDLFKIYQAQGGTSVYKTFQRKIRKLADNRFISVEKIMGGTGGTTTIVYSGTTRKLDEFKTLTDFS